MLKLSIIKPQKQPVKAGVFIDISTV